MAEQCIPRKDLKELQAATHLSALGAGQPSGSLSTTIVLIAIGLKLLLP